MGLTLREVLDGRDGLLRDDLVEFLVAKIGDSAIAGDDESVDNSLPASDLVVRDEICSAFVEPLGQREGRSAVVAALGNDSLDPSEALFDLIRNLQFEHRDHEMVDALARSMRSKFS